jgi:hypothetical protein
MLATLIVPAIEASPRQSQEIKRSDLVEAAACRRRLNTGPPTPVEN